jgi:hypothetical protein
MRVHESLRFYVLSRINDEPSPDPSVSKFISSFSRGSGPYRWILEHSEVQKVCNSGNNFVQTFLEFIGTPVLEESILKHCWSAWNNTYFGINNVSFCSNFLTIYWD